MTRGLVIGKFYPPHKGHHYLINTALTKCDQVTVIVCDKKGQTIPGKLRAQWIKEVHPKAHVLVIDDIYPDDDSQIWADKTVEWLGYVPDFVFTSEEYGERYARIMGSTHILVDYERITVPISGTKVRNNPLDNLNFLEPPVRAYFVKRIAIVGAESSGKTTLAQDLAEYFKTNWVPEYGRLYAEGKLHQIQMEWNTKDFEFIAKKQNETEDKLAESANKVLICDTNTFATSIWHERYMGLPSKKVQQLAKKRKYDLVLLTDASIPFTQDGTRDGEHIRAWMQQRFIDELTKAQIPFIFLEGNRRERLKIAYEYIESLINPTSVL